MNAFPRPSPNLLDFGMGEGSAPVSQLMRRGELTSVFQPIVSLADGRIHAHEALIRGLPGAPLHAPDELFAAARREGLLQDFVLACVVTALQRWSALHEPGRLFVNISASAMIHSFGGHAGEHIADCVRAFGLQPRAIVFELTEHEQVADIPSLVALVEEMQSAGMTFALDDFGDGRSSLRLWSELSPDVVKIDKYFTYDIAHHARKLKTLRALMQIAETFGTTLVAEGVETGDDLRVLRDLGIPLAQGYFLGRPDRLPRRVIDEVASAVLQDSRVAVMPQLRVASSPGRLVQRQICQADPVSPKASNDDVARLFQAHPDWHAVALIDGDKPVGLMGRQQFLDRYAKQYFREIYGRKSCMAFANLSPMLIEVDADISELVLVLTSQDQRYLSEGFIYTQNGKYSGLGTGHQLVRQVTESRIEAARHANPLTLLPGNIPISEHIDRLLAADAEFVASYADLRDFKPFNDHYGYWRGDEVIKLQAAVAQRHCDPRRDFVGHVGGDDFVILFQSNDWEHRCQSMVDDFNRSAIALYEDDERRAGGILAEDRHGVHRFFEFTSLYMGVIPVRAGSRFASAAEVASAAARAKQAAKRLGKGIFVDQPVWATQGEPSADAASAAAGAC